jgi:ankyrin repeat protein
MSFTYTCTRALTFENLFQAAKEGHVAAVLRLLALGAEANSRNKGDLQTPLHWAAAKDQYGAIDALVSGGADVEARDVGGWTPLLMASYRGQVSALECLCEHGANISAVDWEHDTALHCAAHVGHTAAALALVEAHMLESTLCSAFL